ncbi:MAG: PKD domain-containing protein [Bacteroidetes bacterium]|nr:MAG: PKD domain-containing protein [Bacteroidota bacterium]REK32231.1 MAG: PKD domain-containing protein [Bacteroidota bacterium]REK47383.1 MAG: PKD domain-containing protein [Bacteroidota bacterium]
MIKVTYNFVRFLIILIMAIVVHNNEVRASHAMGADLTYACVGGNPNQYLLTYSFYRDCDGISAPSSVTISYTSSCFGGGSVTLNPTPSSPTHITPVCPTALTTCNGGTFTGIEEWIYTGTVTLPGPCADWRFSFSHCCRNGAITTINAPTADNIYVYSLLNNTMGCNNSPTFGNRPVPFACVGQRFCFNHGANDQDGDSITYQLITPFSGATTTVTYTAPYSSTQPVRSNPPVSFNPITGDICMVPTQTDVTVFAVLVSEYRNGVLIGQVERDIQLTINNCNNFLPLLTGINGLPSFTMSACANTPINFWFRSIDADVPNTTRITWDFAIPGGTLTTTGGNRDTAYFSWTPTTAQISNSPYCFTATVEDDNCPYLGVNVYSYCITVCGLDANAGIDQVVNCGATANLSGSATGNCSSNYTYTWNPGGVSGQNLNGVGVGTYQLIVSNNVCSDTDYVDVLPGPGVPVANFNFTTNCSSTQVPFSDQSVATGVNITQWSWNFGDNNTSNQQNPTHTYAANGTYNVTLIVTTATGCQDTIMQQVTVSTNVPNAVFSSPAVCNGTAMNFSDLSTGGQIVAWSWNFGDPGSGANNTSNAQNPSHTFTGAGTFPVSLQVTNAAGCSTTVQQNVTVNANPTVFVADAQICIGSSTNLTAPAGFSNYNWNPGGALQTITVSPVVNSSYTITVTDANNCQGSHTVNVTVNPLPLADAGQDQTICAGTNATLTASAGGATYVWNPGNLNGQSVSVSPASTQIYTLTVTSAAGCVNTDQITINVNPMPLVEAGDDLAICKGESATLTAIGAGNIIWTPGPINGASITVSPLVTTTYTVTISDGIGCTGTDAVTLIVNEIPVADFSNSAPVCQGNIVTFNDISTIPVGTITNWLWDFGNGQSSNQRNPQNTYVASGNFNVQLIVTSNGGCKDTTVQLIVINPIPAVDAGADANICPGFNATLTAAPANQYLWTPGNFITQSITISPAATTDYTLTVTDVNGCQNTDVARVIVNPVPVANAGPDQSICFGENTTLFAAGVGNYTWTPGNSNSASFNVSPAVTTTYQLHVVNAFGCEDFDDVTVQVNPIPVSAFTSSGPVCQGNPVSFTDVSTVSSGSITSWSWDLGSGVVSTIQNPSLPYNTAGIFNIQLIVTTDAGCKDTILNPLTIWATPVASFTNTNVCEGNPIQFSNTSTISDGTSLIYSWNMGDNSGTSNSASPSYQYSVYGSYPATLSVSSVNGCSDQITRIVNVFPLPTAALTHTFACEDSPAQFQDMSTVPAGNISSWYWTFGDGSIGTFQNPQHTYNDPGYYPITLLVSTNNGCQDMANSVIRIAPRPVSDFSTQNVCFGEFTALTDLSYPVTGSITQYSWSFGDGNTSSDQDPVHFYNSPGWYQVSLTVTSDSGCVTTLTRPNAVQIYRPPTALFSSSDAQASDIYPLINFYNETGSLGTYQWDFGDGTTATDYSPTHMYPDVGTYVVRLITVDLNGCVDTVYRTVEIKPSSTTYIPNAFTPNGDKKNDMFRVYTHNVTQLEAQIFDRWGLKVFEWDNLEGGWDGRVEGNPAQADVYIYRVTTTDVNSKREVYIGHVSLVR